jgi:HAD superfamily hydrolase (TIGR01509 family)
MVRVDWSSVKAVIFDMDGLLLDTESLSRKAWALAFEGTPYDIEAIYPQLLGTGVTRCNAILQNHFGFAFPLQELRTKKDAALIESMKSDGVTAKSGARDLLELFTQRKIRTALATSSTSSEATERLRLAQLTHRFEVSAYGDEVKNTKPAPDLYLLAADRLKLSGSECLVLEDSHAGVEAALAASMQVVMVPDLAQPMPWIAERGVPVISSLQELLTDYSLVS